jgi:anaerobic magnesium-protoporphyrin IX monomethyl ester cyclase
MKHDLAIVFPPHWYHPLPPHELAALAAHVRARGRRAWALDANLGGLRRCLSPGFLADCGARLGEPEVGTAAGAAAARALEVLGDPEAFHRPADHAVARTALEQAWRPVERAHAPTQVDLTMLRYRGDVQDLPTCLARATSGAENPFYHYLRDEVVPALLDADARAVLLLFVHPDQLVSLMTLAVELRRAGWRRPVIVGGSLEDQLNFVRLLRGDQHPEYAQLAELFDGVIGYEAEPALDGLLARLEQGGSLADVPNLLHFKGDRLIRPSRFERVRMDALPSPDFSDLDLAAYPFPEPTVSILGSRGCYWERCTFCAISKNQLSYRARDPAAFADDVARAVEGWGVRWFSLRDQLASPSWLRRFSRELLARRLDVRWTCRTRFDHALRRDVLELAHGAGCRQLWLGLESASERLLAAMDKGIRFPDVERILVDCDQLGLGVHTFTMHGFPGETEAEAEATVRFVEEHAGLIDSIDYIDFVWFSDAPLFAERGRLTVLDEDSPRVFQYRFEHRPFEERISNHAHRVELHARIERAIPMPLAHQVHVAYYIDRLGARGWRRQRGQMAHVSRPCCELVSGGSVVSPAAAAVPG